MTKQNRSEKRLLTNLNETLSLLQEAGTPEAIEQRKIITSATHDPRFGYPNLKETKTVKKEGKDTKSKFKSGENSDLQPRARESSDYFPSSVEDIAEKCWRTDCTVIEPGKHTRPKAALKDGNEKIPAIYQTLTDRECYTVFEDTYKGEVKEAMKENCDAIQEKLNNRSESALKQKKLDQLEKKMARFPSLTWFLNQKPKETKTRSDHCTGLCFNCEGPQLNYDTLRRAKKKFCQCKTKRCPNWFSPVNLMRMERSQGSATATPASVMHVPSVR